jgi:hypothetical protein
MILSYDTICLPNSKIEDYTIDLYMMNKEISVSFTFLEGELTDSYKYTINQVRNWVCVWVRV